MRIWLWAALAALLAGAAWAADLATLTVKEDTVITLKDKDDNDVAAFHGISPSGAIMLWADDETLHILAPAADTKLGATLKTEMDLGLAGGPLAAMGMILNTRWSAWFSADEKSVVYPSGGKVLAVSLPDGKETALVTAAAKDDDDNRQVLSACMTPDGAKIVYVVGPKVSIPGMAALAALTGQAMPVPEMSVYLAKTKKSVKITQAKGTGALWTADGQNIVFERQDDATRLGEVWLLDPAMKLTRIPVGGAGVVFGQAKPADAPAGGEGADGGAAPAVPGGIPGFPAMGFPGMPGAKPADGAGSAEARRPEEGPARYAEQATTGAPTLRIAGDTLLVIRSFTDGDLNKRLVAKSYAFAVDMKTLAAVRLDFLPEKVYRIAALDVVEPGLLAAYAVGDEGTTGVYLIDVAKKQAKLVRAIEDGGVGMQPNLLVRAGAIYITIGEEIHKLSLGAAEMKALTFAVTGKAAAGMTFNVFAPKLNPLTGDVLGADLNAPKGACKVDAIKGATGTATQTAAAAQPIEAGDLLVDAAGNIVGEVQ